MRAMSTHYARLFGHRTPLAAKEDVAGKPVKAPSCLRARHPLGCEGLDGDLPSFAVEDIKACADYDCATHKRVQARHVAKHQVA